MDEREYKARLQVLADIEQFAREQMAQGLRSKYAPKPAPAAPVPPAVEPAPDADPLELDGADLDSLFTNE